MPLKRLALRGKATAADAVVSFTLPVVEPSDVIPRVIYQTWETKELPPGMAAAVQQLKDANPGFRHELFDAGDRRAFIEKHFPPQVLYAYDSLIPGAYKADLWRYCVLYMKGGVYLDIKYVPVNGFCLESMINKEHLCRDRPQFFKNGNGVYNAFMILKAGNSYLAEAIKHIYKNCVDKIYGDSPLYPSGPALLGLIIPSTYMYSSYYAGDIWINDMNDKTILRGYNTYRDEQNTIVPNYYSDLWNQRKVYMSNSSIPTIIHQSWVTKDMPSFLQAASYHLQRNNPGYNYILWDDVSCRSFIADNFSKDVLWAYDTILPGAYKCDLFRMCVMYIQGGYYLDIKYYPVNNFSLDLLGNVEVYAREPIAYDSNYTPATGIVYQGIMCSYKNNPRFKYAIDAIVLHVKNKFYGDTATSVTGPTLFGQFFNIDEMNAIPLLYKEHDGIGQLELRSTGKVILKHVEGYREYQKNVYKGNGTKYWKDMWSERNIFDMQQYPYEEKIKLYA